MPGTTQSPARLRGAREFAGDESIVRRPRATAGDAVVEPDWSERLTVSVGQRAGQISGSDHRAIQAAVDYVAGLGGGTVEVLPGTYRFRNAVYLRSNVRLVGHGDDTVLFQEPVVESKLAEDSDWFDQEITLDDARGFEIGDGICLQTLRQDAVGEVVLRRTLVARNGNRFKLDRSPRENKWLMYDTTVSTIFPLLTAEYANNIVIENLTIDGNGAKNPLISGNYSACIWLHDTNNTAIRSVTASSYSGDGIVWGICHDIHVEDCRILNNQGLGLHPSSGSQRPIIRGNTLDGNLDGLFFCWGVKFGLAENNTILNNRRHGISIGHHDDYNVIRDNFVESSGRAGVIFREERGPDFTPRGNRVESNRVVNTGDEQAAAIDVTGGTGGNVIARNTLVEMRGPAERVGIRLASESADNELANNDIQGFATPIADLRQSSQPLPC